MAVRAARGSSTGSMEDTRMRNGMFSAFCRRRHGLRRKRAVFRFNVPANKRFCDELSHRDYLGAIMNMGITRDQVGDILTVRQELGCTAYIFCKSDKREMLLALDRIRHTTVRCREVDFAYTGWQPTFQERQGSVASCRLDAVLAVAVKVSRAKGLEMIQSGNVFLNGRCCTENAKKLEEGDILSIRKHGKFLFEKINAQSKKGRYHITIKQDL